MAAWHTLWCSSKRTFRLQERNLLVSLSYANIVLTGRSVNNQGTERLWKEVYIQVIDFCHLFYKLEDEKTLDVNSLMHIPVCVHTHYRPELRSIERDCIST